MRQHLHWLEAAKSKTHLLVALPCEAKPLIAHYRLKRRMQDEAFAVYENKSLSLTVSGLGKVAMAAAVAYTHAIYALKKNNVWLNIGIAGHPTHNPGQAFIAHKITDAGSVQHGYPPIIYTSPCPTEAVITVSQPEMQYTQNSLYEMEASGFFQTATRFSTAELVQCLKIVSDNTEISINHITAKQTSQWIESQLTVINTLVDLLHELATDNLTDFTPRQLQAFLDQWHFSEQQKLQLSQLLKRWEVLAPEQTLTPKQVTEAQNSKQVLQWLETQVEHLALK